jgi:hypothetical protein
MRASLPALCLWSAVIAALGCTERATRDPEADVLLPKLLLKAAPAPRHTSDLQFGAAIKLLGYDLSTESPSVDKPFTVTWYWQVLAPLDSGYKIFTHLSDGKTNRVNLDADRPLRRIYPESSWKAGDFLRDEQIIDLPGDWNSSLAVFYLGFYSGETRLPVTHGKHDDQRRGEALRLPLTATAANPQPRTVRVLSARHTSGPIHIDGKLNEADWQATPSTEGFVNTMTGGPGSFEARAQVLYDEKSFYCAFVVKDDYLKSTFHTADEHLWEQDTVEVMFDPGGDARNYFELQVSPRGVHFDNRYDSPRSPRPFGHVDWSSQVEAKVDLQGTLDDATSDTGYSVELRVPWAAFATGEPPAAPPTAGAEWPINFFVMDAREQAQRAVGWSPPLVGDFHTLGKFGRVVFTASEPPRETSPASPRAR